MPGFSQHLRSGFFVFVKSRSSSVPKEVFGTKELPGVLVVDRYNAYNRMPSKIQYCYAHLLRDVKDMEKEFPDNTEVASFVEELAPLLSSAMVFALFIPKQTSVQKPGK